MTETLLHTLMFLFVAIAVFIDAIIIIGVIRRMREHISAKDWWEVFVCAMTVFALSAMIVLEVLFFFT
jgi:hypothetical protein